MRVLVTDSLAPVCHQLLADAGINIASLALGRNRPGETALTAIGVDDPVTAEVVDRVKAIEGVEDVRVVQV